MGTPSAFALDVPQGDVDGGDGRGEDALCREEAAAEEHLPDVFAVFMASWPMSSGLKCSTAPITASSRR